MCYISDIKVVSLVVLCRVAWYYGLLRTACSRNPTGIRTPHIFLGENGYVLMSVRVSRVKALLQASLVVLFTCVILRIAPHCVLPQSLQAFVLRTFSWWKMATYSCLYGYQSCKPSYKQAWWCFLLAWYCGLLRTACSRNPYRHSYSAHFPCGKWLRTHVCTSLKD